MGWVVGGTAILVERWRYTLEDCKLLLLSSCCDGQKWQYAHEALVTVDVWNYSIPRLHERVRQSWRQGEQSDGRVRMAQAVGGGWVGREEGEELAFATSSSSATIILARRSISTRYSASWRNMGA